MAYSFVQYTGNGSTTAFSLTFNYISTEHIKVYVGGVLKTVGTHYTFPSASTVQFLVAPANLAAIELRRDTPKDVRLVDFQDSAVLTEAALDLDSDQAMYIVQEAYDVANATGASAAAAASSEAACADYAASADSSEQLAGLSAIAALNSADTAGLSAGAAATSAANASGSASSASTNAANAATSASSAGASAVTSSAAASSASISESNAANSASNASTSASNAATSASNASTSASNASTSASGASTSATNAAASAVAADASAVAAAASAATLTPVATQIHAAVSKTTPVDADELALSDSAATWGIKKLTWANLKATAKTYFDTLYATVAHTHSIYVNKTADAELFMNSFRIRGIKSVHMVAQPVLTTTTGAVTIDWGNGNHQKQNEPTGIITYTFTAPVGVTHLQLLIDSDGTSSAFTHVWPASVIWMGATWAQVANKKAIINFWYDGTNYYAMGVNQV